MCYDDLAVCGSRANNLEITVSLPASKRIRFDVGALPLCPCQKRPKAFDMEHVRMTGQ